MSNLGGKHLLFIFWVAFPAASDKRMLATVAAAVMVVAVLVAVHGTMGEDWA